MKKTIVTIISVGLIAGLLLAPSADAKKKKKPYKRVATGSYTTPSLGVSTPVAQGGLSSCGNGVGCIDFPTSAKDKFASVKVEDATGTKVSGFVSQGDKDGDGIGDGFGSFCGAHASPVAIDPGVPLRVSLYDGVCEDGTPSTGTSGKITVTFTSKL